MYRLARLARLLFAGLVALALGVSSARATSGPSADEYAVKAAFLLNFAKFVEWPASVFQSDRTPLIIGVLGEDPFGPVLDEAVSGQAVGGHPLVVRRLERGDPLRGTHILFVARSESSRVQFILDQLGSSPTLTVSDIEQFTEDGGIIELYLDKSKVRFAINTAATGPLLISSRLLALARIIDRDGGRGTR